MIALLKGIIHNKQKNRLVIMTNGGVGYDVFVSSVLFVECVVGRNIELLTYLKVAEQAMELYGFRDIHEKAFFELLISVKGVGPKGALNILSLGSITDIQSAISRGDVTYLTQVSGLGKRTAERLCVELKNKVGSETTDEMRGDSAIVGDVVEGLVAMGYSKDEVRDVVQGLDMKQKDAEQLLRDALKMLSR